MNIGIILMVVAMMGSAIWLVVLALKAAADPNNTFSELEAAAVSMALLGSAITVSYCGIKYVVLQS